MAALERGEVIDLERGSAMETDEVRAVRLLADCNAGRHLSTEDWLWLFYGVVVNHGA